MHQIRKVIKIMKFEKIREQIETGEIKFFGSHEILDEYDINNINHLTYVIISHYLETKTKNSSYITSTDIFFQTNMSSLTIDKLIKENKEPYAVYFELQSSNSPISLLVYIEIPKYKKGNYLLMYAMGPNVAGVIGSAVAAGFFMMIFKGTM